MSLELSSLLNVTKRRYNERICVMIAKFLLHLGQLFVDLSKKLPLPSVFFKDEPNREARVFLSLIINY